MKNYIFVCVAILWCYISTGKGDEDTRLKAPWVASIFHKDGEGKWEYICGATITSSFTVITSARCVTPRVNGEKFSSRPYHYRYSDLRVVAGLLSSDFNAKDQYTQYAEVGQIRDLYTSARNGDTPDSDLAAIRLKSRFNLTSQYVQDVLLTEIPNSLLEAQATKPGEVVTVSGFNLDKYGGVKTRSQSKVNLQVYELTLTEIGPCIDKYTELYPTHRFNILCGHSTQGSIIPCNLQGAGMVVKVNETSSGTKDVKKEQLYLMGIYSANSASAKTEGSIVTKVTGVSSVCDKDDYVFFSTIGQEGRWGVSHNFCDELLMMCKNDRCRPWKDLCDGVPQCPDNSDENEKVCYNQGPCSVNQFQCKYGACVDKTKVCDGSPDCRDGSDEDRQTACKGQPQRTLKKCPPIPEQKDVEAVCTNPFRNGTYPCTEFAEIDSQALVRCRGVQAICTKEGVWTKSTSLTC